MIQIVNELFSQWNSNDVLYCSWKGNSHLDDSMKGTSDFDILIAEKSLKNGCKILKQTGYMLCVTQRAARYPGIQDWVGVDPQTSIMIHVHLHLYMIAGHRGMMEYILPWNELALSTRQLDEKTGVYIMNASLEIILLYTRFGIECSDKKIVKKRCDWSLKEKTIHEVAYLKERMDFAMCKEMAKNLYPMCYETLVQYILKDNLDSYDLKNITKFFRKECKQWLRYSSFVILLMKKYKKLEGAFMSIYLKKIFGFLYGRPAITKKIPVSKKGLVIAFIGQDGAGKSTVTTDIEKWLSWKLDAHRYYLGSGDHYHSWQKSIQKSLPKRKGFFLSVFSAFLSLTKYNRLAKDVLKTIKNAEKYKDKGGIALFDRYPQTQFLGINDGPKIRHMMSKTKSKYLHFVMSFFAKSEENTLKEAENKSPDVVFKLILSPEESMRRKPHEDIDKIKRKHEIIKCLSFGKAKVYEIDATMNYKDELILIKQLIWQNIQKS